MPAMDYDRIADLYDAYVVTDLDVPFFLAQTRARRRVLELMSGTGRVSIPLLEAGVDLTCVDSSPEMLARLRVKLGQKGLAAPVIEMDVVRLDLAQQFDLIILPFHSFAEIVDPMHSARRCAGSAAIWRPAESSSARCTIPPSGSA
jgi:SAM-dependent methyltransferase